MNERKRPGIEDLRQQAAEMERNRRGAAAPVPVEEPEGRSPKDVEDALRYAKSAMVAAVSPSPAPEIKERQVWRRKGDGYTALVREIYGDTVWFAGVEDGRLGSWFVSGLHTDWELVSEPETAAPEIKVGQRYERFNPPPGLHPGEFTLCRKLNVIGDGERWEGIFSGHVYRESAEALRNPRLWRLTYDPPPSLNPEGLAKLDERRRLYEQHDSTLSAYDKGAYMMINQCREWLVSTPTEEQGDGE